MKIENGKIRKLQLHSNLEVYVHMIQPEVYNINMMVK